MYYQRDTRTDRERYLENELERLESERHEEYEECERRREERMREYRERAEAHNRSASSWPEALSKQAYLFQREANDWPADDPDFPSEADDYFGPGSEACKRALVIWEEVEASKAEEIKALEAQIEALRESIKLEVSEKLLAEGVDKPLGWKSVAWAIRDEEDPGRWLDW
jgi:hypothetical protein